LIFLLSNQLFTGMVFRIPLCLKVLCRYVFTTSLLDIFGVGNFFCALAFDLVGLVSHLAGYLVVWQGLN
jgi:hypothetical protein